MDELIDYLNGLEPADQAAFALRCKTTANYLRKACYARQRFGVDLCLAIAAESGGLVKPEALRPDLNWDYLRAAARVGTVDTTAAVAP